MAMRPEGADYHAAQPKSISVRGSRMWASGFQPVGLTAQCRYCHSLGHNRSRRGRWSPQRQVHLAYRFFPTRFSIDGYPRRRNVWILRRVSTDKIR